jgi:hypothetical protein
VPHCRVVAPGVVRLPLSDGDWIDVKRELNAGEYGDLLTALVDRQPFAKILQYVIGWSLIGLDGNPLPYALDLPETVRRDTIKSLDKQTLRELIAVLDKHEAIEEAALEKKRSTPVTRRASNPISESAAP